MRRWWLVALGLVAVGAARASPFGCEVLLCLSNPVANGGPMGVDACVAPITRLYRDLGRGRPFPRCDLADGNDGSSYARQLMDPYDPCPVGLRPAMDGALLVQGRRGAGSVFMLAGLPRVSPDGGDGGTAGGRACVGRLLGWVRQGDADSPVNIAVYDRVVWQPAQSPRAIDVFVDGRWRQRVHW